MNEASYRQIINEIKAEALPPAAVKGVQEPLHVYRIATDTPHYAIAG
jgi:class 3 adenylate cyclase